MRPTIAKRHALRIHLDRVARRRRFRHGLAVTLAAALIAGAFVLSLA